MAFLLKIIGPNLAEKGLKSKNPAASGLKMLIQVNQANFADFLICVPRENRTPISRLGRGCFIR